MASSVCVSRCQMLLKNELNRFGLRTLFSAQHNAKVSWSRRIRHPHSHCHQTISRRSIATSSASFKKTGGPNPISPPSSLEYSSPDDVSVQYVRGLPQITVPLPSRREKCRFILRPISNTVGDFVEFIKKEDHGIDRVVFQTSQGVKIASSNSIESLLEDKFKLVLNDVIYNVDTPAQERLTREQLNDLGSVRNLVHQLYEALNVQEHQLKLERELLTKIEAVKQDLDPLELKRTEIDMQSDTNTKSLVWLGLGMMGVQFGVLARLTWWEYSWDIMEPVTYFVTYGTTMMCYAYYVLTKQEAYMPDVRDRQYLITFHKRAKKAGFDINKYNQLKDEIHKLETDLKMLRDPKQLHLPINQKYPDLLLNKSATIKDITNKQDVTATKLD